MKTIGLASNPNSILLAAFALWSGTQRGKVQAFTETNNRIVALPRQRAYSDFQPWGNQNSHRNHVCYARQHKRHITRLQTALAIPESSVYLTLLACQFGFQPLLTKAFTPNTIVRSTVLLAQDFTKFLLSLSVLLFTGSLDTALKQWTLRGALLGAGIPSVLYLIQNYCSLVAYQNLPPVTYNVLNQTKTLSAALCCFLLMGKRQSPIQIVALVTLLFSALVLEKIVPIRKRNTATAIETCNSSDEDPVSSTPRLASGVIPVVIASMLSGFTGALVQKNLQILKTNTYIFSMELSVFSIMIMTTSLILGTPDGKRLGQRNAMVGWSWKTLIPVLTNAAGGVLVGLVTKHSGAVKKGFALIFGLVISGVLQSYFSSDDDGVSVEQIAGGLLASISLWMHSAFPP
eukprot:scaffold1184_cov132-Cylindrotheca_fusiformis.AAC.4